MILIDDMARTGMTREEMEAEYDRAEWERNAMKEM